MRTALYSGSAVGSSGRVRIEHVLDRDDRRLELLPASKRADRNAGRWQHQGLLRALPDRVAIQPLQLVGAADVLIIEKDLRHGVTLAGQRHQHAALHVGARYRSSVYGMSSSASRRLGLDAVRALTFGKYNNLAHHYGSWVAGWPARYPCCGCRSSQCSKGSGCASRFVETQISRAPHPDKGRHGAIDSCSFRDNVDECACRSRNYASKTWSCSSPSWRRPVSRRRPSGRRPHLRRSAAG